MYKRDRFKGQAYSPISDPIHMVANLDDGRSLRVFCTSTETFFLRALDRPTREEGRREFQST